MTYELSTKLSIILSILYCIYLVIRKKVDQNYRVHKSENSTKTIIGAFIIIVLQIPFTLFFICKDPSQFEKIMSTG